ncbi:MAG: DUF167 domain-containing protein [Bryobacteraceae bacterium]|nr:DUF167 domain-containing protein [Solibacteraceae bacterium]MCO5349673.1 DUF167 domain-containing protein [Bryobacteraceae bacterium]
MQLPGDLLQRLHSQNTLVLALKITPKAPRTAWAGALDDGTIKIRVAAAPEKGKANEELVRFLACQLNVPPGNVEILSGATSQRKQVRVSAAPAPPSA